MDSLAKTQKLISDELKAANNDAYNSATKESKAKYDQANEKVSQLLDKTNGANSTTENVNKLEKDLIDARNGLEKDTNLGILKEQLAEEIANNTKLTDEEKTKLNEKLDNIDLPLTPNDVDDFKQNLTDLKTQISTIENIKQTTLTEDEKADLIEDVLKTNVDDDKNKLNNKNTLNNSLTNIKEKEDLFTHLNSLDKNTVKDDVKEQLINSAKNLDPTNKGFDKHLANEKAKEEKVKEISSNNDLTNKQKDDLIKHVVNLNSQDDNFTNNINTNTNKKIETIKEINSNNNLTQDQKDKLSSETAKLNDDNLDQSLENIKDKVSLSEQINNLDIDSNFKDKLNKELDNIDANSTNSKEQLANLKTKLDKINNVNNSNDLTNEQKNDLINDLSDNSVLGDKFDQVANNIVEKESLYEVVNLNSTIEDKARLNEDINNLNPQDPDFSNSLANIKKKIELLNKVINSKLPQNVKENLLNSINALNPSSENFAKLFANEESKVNSAIDLYETLGKANISSDSYNDLVREISQISNTDSEAINNFKAKVEQAKEIVVDNDLTTQHKLSLIKDLVDNKATDLENFNTKKNNLDNKFNIIKSLIESTKNLKEILADETKKVGVKDNLEQNIVNSEELLNNFENNLDNLAAQDKVNRDLINDINKGNSNRYVWDLVLTSLLACLTLGIILAVPAIRKKIAKK
ncbi:hypothetical protein ACLRE7_00790 [Mycoplasmopsis meleagridis]|uniref:hypothetical protein n=1 Tax=Mycoplasmopsis meleagridis TaxID=29561 RepID=UPI003A87FB7B